MFEMLIHLLEPESSGALLQNDRDGKLRYAATERSACTTVRSTLAYYWFYFFF